MLYLLYTQVLENCQRASNIFTTFVHSLTQSSIFPYKEGTNKVKTFDKNSNNLNFQYT